METAISDATSHPRAAHPVVGVGALVIRDGKVLLIKRGKEPLRGRWLVPGGTVELGEGLEAALVREVLEETGLTVRPLRLLTVFDRIHRDEAAVRYHFVIVDYLCEYLGGDAMAGSDAMEVAWVEENELTAYDVPAHALHVIRLAFGVRRDPGRA